MCAKQVPEEAAAAPVPTRGQLSDQFADVARLSRELSLLPEGQGGMLSVAVAKLSAKLKVGGWVGCWAGAGWVGGCWWVLAVHLFLLGAGHGRQVAGLQCCRSRRLYLQRMRTHC